jgi:hypothetical protein
MIGGSTLEQKMPNTTGHNAGTSAPAADNKAEKQRDKSWDERLRLVGDANFVDVPWSGKDEPCWPLPKK